MAALGVTTCGSQDKIVTIEDTTYYFPASHVRGFLPPEENHGSQYLRLKPVSGRFLLIYDPLTSSKGNEQGPDVPTIPHINFAPGGKVDMFGSGAEAIICLQTTTDVAYTCGMRVSDNGLDWIIIFDRDLLASAPMIKAKAEGVLWGYRTDGRLKT